MPDTAVSIAELARPLTTFSEDEQLFRDNIRQFAEEQLADAGELQTVVKAHIHHYANQAAEVLTWMGSPREREALAYFEAKLKYETTPFTLKHNLEKGKVFLLDPRDRADRRDRPGGVRGSSATRT